MRRKGGRVIKKTAGRKETRKMRVERKRTSNEMRRTLIRKAGQAIGSNLDSLELVWQAMMMLNLMLIKNNDSQPL